MFSPFVSLVVAWSTEVGSSCKAQHHVLHSHLGIGRNLLLPYRGNQHPLISCYISYLRVGCRGSELTPQISDVTAQNNRLHRRLATRIYLYRSVMICIISEIQKHNENMWANPPTIRGSRWLMLLYYKAVFLGDLGSDTLGFRRTPTDVANQNWDLIICTVQIMRCVCSISCW